MIEEIRSSCFRRSPPCPCFTKRAVAACVIGSFVCEDSVADTKVTKRRPLASVAASSDIFSHPIVSTGAPPTRRISLMMSRTWRQSSGGAKGDTPASASAWWNVLDFAVGVDATAAPVGVLVGGNEHDEGLSTAADDDALPPRDRFVAALTWLLTAASSSSPALTTFLFFSSSSSFTSSCSSSILMCPRFGPTFRFGATPPGLSFAEVLGAAFKIVAGILLALVNLAP